VRSWEDEKVRKGQEAWRMGSWEAGKLGSGSGKRKKVGR